jgi:hypothetical protein
MSKSKSTARGRVAPRSPQLSELDVVGTELGVIAGRLTGIREGLRLLEDGGSNRPADKEAWQDARDWFCTVLQDAVSQQISAVEQCESKVFAAWHSTKSEVV